MCVFINPAVPNLFVTRDGFSSGSDSKESPAKQVTWVQSLGQEDPLEKEVATYSSILAWRISWTEEPAIHGVTKSQT